MNIDIKGKVFDVSPEILSGMLDAMEKTGKDGLEHGFLGCDTPKGIVKGQECLGNACSIQLKGCEDVGPVAVNFHSHPDVISFSLTDYLQSLQRANIHPEKKQLMCVALKEAGVRCKAVTKIPPPSLKVPMVDCDETREMVKPFFTKKVSISKEQLKELLAGTPWEKLSPEEQIIAIDEGDVVVPKDLFEGVGKLKSDAELKKLAYQKKLAWAGLLPEESTGGSHMAKKGLIEVAQEYINDPSGKYPWETKTVTKSVKMPDGGVGLEMAGMPTLESDETQFIPTRDVEVPDPEMIHYGEVAQYIAAFSPIILSTTKDDAGKFKVMDGRHRLAAYRASGYKQIPCVFTKETEYK